MTPKDTPAGSVEAIAQRVSDRTTVTSEGQCMQRITTDLIAEFSHKSETIDDYNFRARARGKTIFCIKGWPVVLVST
mgnify:CR=1 FL=1